MDGEAQDGESIFSCPPSILAMAMETLSCGVLSYSLPSHEILLMNKEACRIFGCEGAGKKFQGESIMASLSRDDLPVARATARKLQKPGDSVSYQFHVARGARKAKTVQCVSKRLCDGEREFILSVMQDMTSLEAQTHALTDFAMMQEQLLDSLNSGLFCYSIPNHAILFMNEEARRILECDASNKDKAVKKFIRERIFPESKKDIDECASLTEAGQEKVFECRAKSDGGKILTLQIYVRLIQKPSGQKVILVNITDLTERTRLMELMKWERRQYREALTANSAFVFTFDLTSGIIDNDFSLSPEGSMGSLLGISFPCSYDYLMKKGIEFFGSVFYPPESKKLVTRDGLLSEFSKGNRLVEMEIYSTRRKTYQKNTFLLAKSDSGHIGAIAFARDLTKQRAMELERYAELERITRSLDIQTRITNSFSGIYFATWLLDLPKNKISELVVPEERRSIVGDSKGNLKKALAASLKNSVIEPKDEMKKFLDLSTLSERLAQAKAISCEYKAEGVGWCRANFIVVDRDESGNAQSVALAVRDIDADKRRELDAEMAMRQAFESASRANSAKTEFLSRMSHDIRTPMNAIIGMTAIAGAHLDDRERLEDCLSKITMSSRHLLALINDVLDMSRIESGKISLGDEEFNIRTLLKDTLALVKPQADEKRHKISSRSDAVAHENVMGDSLRVQQALVNIVSNAIKYTGDGGIIEITLRERTTKSPSMSCYEFTVKDNGIGMPKEFLDKIFLPFERVQSKETARIPGTGLGMAIAKNIVGMMGGDIKVKSALGEGSTFTVTIYLKTKDAMEKPAQTRDEPRADEADGGANPLAALERRYEGRRALLVDDNEINRDIAAEIFGMMGMQVDCAEDGKAAVEKFAASEENRYDLIFMDLQMPVMNGFDAAAAIRASGRGDSASVPIIAMSANAFAEDVVAARNAGMNDHIAKPIDISRLQNTLDSWL